jgi:hypothetical protein
VLLEKHPGMTSLCQYYFASRSQPVLGMRTSLQDITYSHGRREAEYSVKSNSNYYYN